MFAVIKTGGKQYKVAKNDVLDIEKVEGAKGATIIFEDVLLVSDESGKLSDSKGVKVSAEVLEQKKDAKIIVFKKKRRHNYRRKKGHRQEITVVRIQDIGKDAKVKAAPAKKAEKEAPKKVEAKKSPAKKVEAEKIATEAKKEDK